MTSLIGGSLEFVFTAIRGFVTYVAMMLGLYFLFWLWNLFCKVCSFGEERPAQAEKARVE